MDGNPCQRSGCGGSIDDGYCDVCGHAAVPGAAAAQASARVQSTHDFTGRSFGSAVGTGSSGTGASSLTSRSKGSRRTSRSDRSTRRQLGAGLVNVPELPSAEPEKALLIEPKVSDSKRICANCDKALKRDRGFCSQCGQKYSFVATLNPGDIVAGQYEVKGALAFGGLGWIYLGFDKTLGRYVVLKGLLNTEDASSAAVAVAERQFLAAVKHANIVGIYNFVNHGSEGFIVMEYVGGKTLKDIRKERGGLPVAEAIAYIHRILGAFSYLHGLGLVYCDFKPENVMLEGDDVKLIDMGGVRRIDDPDGDIYGTVGYTAPEAGEGPTVVTDLYTIGRSLAILLANIPSFSKEYRYSLPGPDMVPLFAQQESLYRFLLKSTAANPDDRFQSADEMADQLLGVLREIVAVESGQPRPWNSPLFQGDQLALAHNGNFDAIAPDYHQLPGLSLLAGDPALNALANTSNLKGERQIETLTSIVAQFPTSREAKLRLASGLADRHHYAQANTLLETLETADPWDWRVPWYRGRSGMALGNLKEAQACFDQVYSDLPGELAPKLALALAAEQAKNYPLALKLYKLVVSTDPSYVSAAFGLSRCLAATADRAGAIGALNRVPPTSSLHGRAQVEVARTLIDPQRTPPGQAELQQASKTVEALTLAGMERHRLAQQIFETALKLLDDKTLSPSKSVAILGQSLQEAQLRTGLEQALRAMAHLSTGDEKIRLVDQANRVRPITRF
jgi:serine/threonine-protein kinase PknG